MWKDIEGYEGLYQIKKMEYTIKDYIEKYWQDIEGNTPEYTFAKINEKSNCEAFGFDWNDWQKEKNTIICV